MELDPVFLSRVQFAFVISFHIIFPAFTIGLAAWLATIEGVRLAHRQPALPAGLRLLAQGVRGVVRHGRGHGHRHGLPVRHQLERAGRADRLDPGAAAGLRGLHRLHARSDILRRHAAGPRPGVARASTSSPAAWCRSARCSPRSGSSPTTAGCRCRSATRSSTARSSPRTGARSCSGRCMMVRWPHMLLAAFLTTGDVRRRHRAPGTCCAAVHRAEARVMLHWGLGLVGGADPGAALLRPLTGLYVLKHQPAKFAAIEARWQSQQPASEVLIAMPDPGERAQPVRDRNPQARQLHRLGQLDRAARSGWRPSRRRPPPGADPVLRRSASWSAWG